MAHDAAIVTIDYDPRWPMIFEAERRRLQGGLGEVAVRIEHVGSTAVPELAAKPVIDLQVAVPALADEDSYRPGLESLGLVLRARAADHRRADGPGGAGALRLSR